MTLSWPAVPFATGYKVWVWDGYAYRPFNVGNTTSWDSRAAKIYPPETTLNACPTDSSTANLFLYGGAGLDLRDSPVNLYRCTAGSAYNSDTRYFFRVTAYNGAGEVAGQEWYVPTYSTALPDRTDTVPAQVDQVQINGGRDVAATSTVQLAVYASDDKSGVAALLLSNDGTAWTRVSYAGSGEPVTWKLAPGEGSRTVYVRACDRADNCGDARSGSVYLMWDATLQSWINSSLSGSASGPQAARGPGVTFTATTQDPQVFQVRWSVDGIAWGPWEPLGEKRLAFPRDGAYSVACQFRSTGGDLSPVRYLDIVVDSEPPKVRAGWVGNAVVVGSSNTARVWIEADDNTTPVDQLQMSLDGGATWVPFAETAVLYFNQDPPGTVLRKIRVRDKAGNIGQVALWIVKP